MERGIFSENYLEFHVKVKDSLEACKLLAFGFEYVTELNGKTV